MERKTYEKGTYLCKRDDKAEQMFLIQEGIVEIAIPYDKRMDENFVIERLTKGAIINHRSFLLKDEADTDFLCFTNVSVFVLSYQNMKQIKDKRVDLQKAKNDVKQELFQSYEPIALDYIIHNNERQSLERYQ